MRCLVVCTILCAVVGIQAAAWADETCAEPVTEKTALFNGKDFTGWKLFLPGNADVTKTWSVKNGVIAFSVEVTVENAFLFFSADATLTGDISLGVNKKNQLTVSVSNVDSSV